MIEIKKRLKILIKENGGNQAEIARQIGIEPTHLGSVFSDEKRGLSATIIVGLARAGYDIQWLLTGESNLKRMIESEKKLRDAHTLIDSLERILKS